MSAVAGLEMDGTGRRLASEVAQETDGNPFFVAELLRHLSESGAIAERPDGRRELRSSITDLGLPSSVRDVVSRRVARLGDDLEQILTVAAVIGRTFDVELLDLLVEGTEDELLDALEEALKASVLVESADRVGRFSFAHALINRALYDGVGRDPARPASPAGRRSAGAALEHRVGRATGGGALGGHGRLRGRLGRGPVLSLAQGRRLTAGGGLPARGRRAGGAGGRAGGDGGAPQPGARAHPRGRCGAPAPGEPASARSRTRATSTPSGARDPTWPMLAARPDRRRALA